MIYLSYLEVKVLNRLTGIDKFLKIIHECFIIVFSHQHAM